MTDPSQPNSPNDLAEGWPADPANAELARFARKFQSARPRLGEAAMNRIRQRMNAAIEAKERWRLPRFVRWALGGTVAAAAALLAIGVVIHLRSPSRPGPPLAPASAEPIRDTFEVRFVPANPPPGDRPLVPLDAYQSLYASRR